MSRTNPTDINSKKTVKTSSKAMSTTKKNMVATSESKKCRVSDSEPESVGLHDEEIKSQQKRKTKSRVRGLLSLSIVAYLGYYSLYACGSPFDDSISKPAICAGIDPIKLDLYALYESDFYQVNLNPHIHPLAARATDIYYTYGIPASIKAQEIYFSHGKPRLEQSYAQAQQFYEEQLVPLYKQKVLPVYKNKVLPLYNQKVTPYVNLYLAKAQPYIDQMEPMYTNQVKPAFQQATSKVNEAKHFVLNYNNLPPSLKQYTATVMDWINRAENTEMKPILVKFYWATLDVYKNEFLPVLNRSHIVIRIKLYYKENIKPFVDQYIVPVLMEINHRVHLDQLVHHALSFLPQARTDVPLEEVVYTASSINTQPKTENEEKMPTTNEIPITPTKAETKKVTKTVTVLSRKSNTSTSSVSASTSASASVVTVTVVEECSSSIHVSAYASVITSTTSSAIATGSPETTIGYVSNDDDIKTHQESKSIPSFTSPPPVEEQEEEIKYVQEQDVVPKAEDKKAIYCPTCNAAEEEIMVAPTEKYLMTANTEKHLHALSTEKELFEVHTEEAAPTPPAQPTSPNTELYKDMEQIIIQAPIPTKPVIKEEVHEAKEETVIKEEDIVFTILPVKEEEITFSILPVKEEQEQPDVTREEPDVIKEEDIVFSILPIKEEAAYIIQTSAPTPSAIPTSSPKEEEQEPVVIESVQEDILVQDDIEIINEAIAQEIKNEEHQVKQQQIKEDQVNKEKEQQQKIFVPPAIEKEELVLEHVQPIDNEEPVFIKVEEEPVQEPMTVEEPIVIVDNNKEEDHPQVRIRAPFSKEPVTI